MALVTKPDSEFLTITQIYLMSLKSVNSRKTVSSVLNNIARIFKATDHVSFDWLSLRPADIDMVIAVLSERKKLKPSTINSYISAVRALFKSGYINGLVDTETFQRMSQLKSLKASRIVSNREPIQMDAVKILVKHCETQANAMGLRDAAMISVMASCGVRRAELVTIKLEDYNRENKTFTVIGKGNKERVVPIPAATLKRIESWIGTSRGDVPGFLFCRVRRHDKVSISDTEYLSGNGVYDMLKKRTQELEQAHIRPHGLRRFCGTTLLKSGNDLVLVRDYLGHESISTTQIYIEKNEDELHEAAEIFDI